MMPKSKSNLIYDLGFFNGDDTDFYLSKGFQVIAVEANPKLVQEGSNRFRSQIQKGNLVLLNRAISNDNGKVNFYVHSTKPDWSSCLINMAESDGSQSTEIQVESLRLSDLFQIYGIPYYLKVDLEGVDKFVAGELFQAGIKPEFVSFELSKKEYFSILSWLYLSGYSRYQLVNQANNPERGFSKYSSGFFGDLLPTDKWLTFDEVLTRYIKYKELKQVDNVELALGWLDIHARLDSA